MVLSFKIHKNGKNLLLSHAQDTISDKELGSLK